MKHRGLILTVNEVLVTGRASNGDSPTVQIQFELITRTNAGDKNDNNNNTGSRLVAQHEVPRAIHHHSVVVHFHSCDRNSDQAVVDVGLIEGESERVFLPN